MSKGDRRPDVLGQRLSAMQGVGLRQGAQWKSIPGLGLPADDRTVILETSWAEQVVQRPGRPPLSRGCRAGLHKLECAPETPVLTHLFWDGPETLRFCPAPGHGDMGNLRAGGADPGLSCKHSPGGVRSVLALHPCFLSDDSLACLFG